MIRQRWMLEETQRGQQAARLDSGEAFSERYVLLGLYTIGIYQTFQRIGD